MALSNQALTTVGRFSVMTSCSTINDMKLEMMIEAASARIISALGRPIVYEAAREEMREGFGMPLMDLELYPVVSVASVEWMEYLNTPLLLGVDEYTIESKDGGLLRNVCGTWCNTAYRTGALLEPVNGTQVKKYRVTYEAGYVTPNQADNDPLLARTLPFDLESLCIEMVKAQNSSLSASTTVSERKLMSATYKYNLASVQAGYESVLSAHQSTINRYARKD